MNTASERLPAAVGQEASNELDGALAKIKHCVQQLTDEQVCQRPSPQLNSIANLMVHLGGNLRQWIVAGVGGAVDNRERWKEFDRLDQVTRAALLEELESIVNDVRAVLLNVSTEDLLDPRRIQGFEVTGLQAIFESVAHFRGHAQEIVHMARKQLGDAYRFDFVPETPEQGAREP